MLMVENTAGCKSENSAGDHASQKFSDNADCDMSAKKGDVSESPPRSTCSSKLSLIELSAEFKDHKGLCLLAAMQAASINITGHASVTSPHRLDSGSCVYEVSPESG